MSGARPGARSGASRLPGYRAEPVDEPAGARLGALGGQGDDRVKGLRAGGDDDLSKPYAFAELLARLDGGSSFGDCDAWYCVLEGTAEGAVAEAQARALTDLLAFFALGGEREILLCVDEFSAVSRRQAAANAIWPRCISSTRQPVSTTSICWHRASRSFPVGGGCRVLSSAPETRASKD